MDRIDHEILNGIGFFERKNQCMSTYTLATYVSSISKKDTSQSIGNLDSTFRYHCEKLYLQGLLSKEVNRKGKQPLILYSSMPQGFAVSDGSLILLSNLLLNEYFCPYSLKCDHCKLPENKEPLAFKPVKRTRSKKYIAPQCLFLQDILGATEDMLELYEIKQKLLRILNVTLPQITVPI